MNVGSSVVSGIVESQLPAVVGAILQVQTRGVADCDNTPVKQAVGAGQLQSTAGTGATKHSIPKFAMAWISVNPFGVEESCEISNGRKSSETGVDRWPVG